MISTKKMAVIVASSLFITSVGVGVCKMRGLFTSSKSFSDYYNDSVGIGRECKINIDGDFSDWTSQMLIAQGVANDSYNALSNKKTNVSDMDTYALYAGWDEKNLYLMWEVVDVRDVNDDGLADNLGVCDVDIPQIIALDTDKNKSGDGSIFGSDSKIWDMNIGYDNGVDTVLCFSSIVGEGKPKMFTTNEKGYFSYTSEYCKDFDKLGIKYACGQGNISGDVLGIQWSGENNKNIENLYDSNSSYVSMTKLGHDNTKDIMYEMSIPLASLKVSKEEILTNGIGVMHISTDNNKAVAAIPNDKSIYTNEDTIFTCNLAKIGRGKAGCLVDGTNNVIRSVEESLPKSVEKDEIKNEKKTYTKKEVKEIQVEKENNIPKQIVASKEPVEVVNENKEKDNETTPVNKNTCIADSINKGTILHAWSWSFNTIADNMQDIKNAGYTSVQTSPVNECYIGDNGSLDLKNWSWLYQPVSYNIGNYQLGTKEEFKNMCDVAKKFGIKIIVDVVPNHMTSEYSAINDNYKTSAYFHTNKEICNWSDRYQVTQLAKFGLWDVNTQNEDVINNFSTYLKELLELGASGFRYDSATNIELPDDNEYAGDFWTRVLQNNAEFQYGEVIKNPVSREMAYAEYMNITDSSYGYVLRKALKDNDFSVNDVETYNEEIDSSKLVTWVESHDNYLNDGCETVWLTNEQIKLGYALLAARKDTTPLFFSRPKGAGGTSYDSRFATSSQIGDVGDELYKDDEIAAVNIFRNVMQDETEILRNGNDSKKILMIERGTKGLVIINLNYSSTYLNYTTNLSDGRYVNKTDDDSNYEVNDRKIIGMLPARSVVVLYNNETEINNSYLNNEKETDKKTNEDIYDKESNLNEINEEESYETVKPTIDSQKNINKIDDDEINAESYEENSKNNDLVENIS